MLINCRDILVVGKRFINHCRCGEVKIRVYVPSTGTKKMAVVCIAVGHCEEVAVSGGSTVAKLLSRLKN